MGVRIRAIFMIIIFMGEEFIVGLMVENIMGLGSVIKCMDMEYLLGQMVENTKVNILKIRNKVKESSNGQMEEYILEDG